MVGGGGRLKYADSKLMSKKAQFFIIFKSRTFGQDWKFVRIRIHLNEYFFLTKIRMMNFSSEYSMSTYYYVFVDV